MLPILFQFGPLTIYSFGVFMALAAIAATWVVQSELKRKGYNPELASTMVFAAAIGGLVGARILFIFEEWSNFLRSPWDYIFTGAGFTWYGGFLGGVLGVTWVVLKNNIPWLKAADIAAPALAVGYGIGRLGCHVAGDGDWGTVTNVPWGVAYTNAIIGWVDPSTGIPYPPGVRVHPTPIYEFLESAVIFGILWALRKKDVCTGRDVLALPCTIGLGAIGSGILAVKSSLRFRFDRSAMVWCVDDLRWIVAIGQVRNGHG